VSGGVLPADAAGKLADWRRAGETVVFTSGVFDLLHRGHVEYLEGRRPSGAGS
jgi:bifunctional ADP-heptose synthase (sugar kinase/adenylyltransferase)